MQTLKKTILIIGTVWPEPESSAAGSRMLQLLTLFENANYHIVFASTAQQGDYSKVLPTVVCEQIQMNSDSFDDFIAKLNPHYVMFDRFMVEEQFGWRVARTCPNTIRILDTEDLHCLRKSRENALRTHVRHTTDMITAEEIALREVASILRCDITLIISQIELDILTQIFKIDRSLLHYIPLFVQKEALVQQLDVRRDFVFIGNFLHKPNDDAVGYLKTVIWPNIRKRLKANLHIYGAYMPDSISQYHKPEEGFLVHGRAPNALDVISQAKVMLAPLRFGAGLKGKLLEAMAVGTPSVTTTIGAEGISFDLWSGFIEDESEKFADQAVVLYEDENLWRQKQQVGFKIIEERFSVLDFGDNFIQSLEALSTSITAHRQKNFIGRMLQHHTMRSTEFMSRWIQEKNK